MQQLGHGAVAQHRRRDQHDGGLLHPDALRHDHAAHGHQPGGPRHGRLRDVPDRRGRRSPPGLPPLLNARDVLRFATINGAKHLRLDSKTGSLNAGQGGRHHHPRRAPRLNVAPLNHVPGAVVSLMDRTNVETVIVAGKIRKWKGQLLDVDLRPAAQPARGLARLPLRRGGRRAGSVPQLAEAACRQPDAGRLRPPRIPRVHQRTSEGSSGGLRGK